MVVATETKRAGRRALKGLPTEDRKLYDSIPADVDYVFHPSFNLPATGEQLFGDNAETISVSHWRQYPASATNCADALGLVDHWRYSHDPARREKCARLFRDLRAARARQEADPDQLIVLA